MVQRVMAERDERRIIMRYFDVAMRSNVSDLADLFPAFR
jgi:hypothetical protein